MPPTSRIRRRLVVYTILIDQRPVLAFTGSSQKEAQECYVKIGFREELLSKRSGGRPLWDGKALLTARSANPGEQEQYQSKATVDDDGGDMPIVYLVEID